MFIVWLIAPQTKVRGWDASELLADAVQAHRDGWLLVAQGAQLLFESFVRPFLVQYASKIDPIFKTTQQASPLVHMV